MIAKKQSAKKAQKPPKSRGIIAKILNRAFFQIPYAAFSKTTAIPAAPNIPIKMEK